MDVRNATIEALLAELAAGRTTAAALVAAYRARIEAHDRAGPGLNAVRVVNPDAPGHRRGQRRPRRPRAARSKASPSCVKDNIATADAQPTTAGSLALEAAGAVRDATVVAKLREAGAVLLGKANLTEFANILAVGMPAGYSSLGGQVLNPYAPAGGRARHPLRAARRLLLRLRRSRSRPGWRPPPSAPKPPARCCRRPT